MSDAIAKLRANYDDLNQRIRDLRAQMTVQSKEILEQVVADLFDTCPEVHQIHWTQYTPYFNDGEECMFGVNEICWLLKSDLDDWDDDFYDGSSIVTAENVKSAEKDLEEVRKYLQDPEKWRVEKYGAHAQSYHRPYPDTENKALRMLEKARTKYEQFKDRGDVISQQVNQTVQFIAGIDDDIMKQLFGDHVSIKITREGMEIDEYEHD